MNLKLIWLVFGLCSPSVLVVALTTGQVAPPSSLNSERISSLRALIRQAEHELAQLMAIDHQQPLAPSSGGGQIHNRGSIISTGKAVKLNPPLDPWARIDLTSPEVDKVYAPIKERVETELRKQIDSTYKVGPFIEVRKSRFVDGRLSYVFFFLAYSDSPPSKPIHDCRLGFRAELPNFYHHREITFGSLRCYPTHRLTRAQLGPGY